MSTDHIDEPENPIADAIDAAEDILDPLEGLVEKTAADPGAPFMPEALERACGAEEGRSRRVRGAAVATEKGRVPGDGAR